MISAADYSFVADVIDDILELEQKAFLSITAARENLDEMEDPTIWGFTSEATAIKWDEGAGLEIGRSKELCDNLLVTIQRRRDEDGAISKAISSLQEYIVLGYGDVNLFLSDNNILVGERFAEQSAQAGYPIDSESIS